MAQELPFLNFTAEDINALTPINSQCTVKCEITKIWAKEASKGGTNIWFVYTCTDDNSPEKGHPSRPACFSLAHPQMFAPLLLAALRINKEDLKPEQFSLEALKGKELMVKYDLRDNGRDEFTVQAIDYMRSDKA